MFQQVNLARKVILMNENWVNYYTDWVDYPNIHRPALITEETSIHC